MRGRIPGHSDIDVTILHCANGAGQEVVRRDPYVLGIARRVPFVEFLQCGLNRIDGPVRGGEDAICLRMRPHRIGQTRQHDFRIPFGRDLRDYLDAIAAFIELLEFLGAVYRVDVRERPLQLDAFGIDLVGGQDLHELRAQSPGLIGGIAAHMRGRLHPARGPIKRDKGHARLLGPPDRSANRSRIESPRNNDIGTAIQQILDIGGLPAAVVVRHVHDPFDIDAGGLTLCLGLGLHEVFPSLVERALARVPG